MRAGFLTLLVVVSAFIMIRGEGEFGIWSDAAPGRKIILEVINRHFTVGKKIPSIYLRVFSNGTAECHTEKFWDEADVVKTKVLSEEEFERLKAVINDPNLLDVQKRYELMHFVVDSWMEWNIKLAHSGMVQRIQVVSFSPDSARERNQPYPDALVKLGCSILRTRNEVYGGVRLYSKADCPDFSTTP